MAESHGNVLNFLLKRDKHQLVELQPCSSDVPAIALPSIFWRIPFKDPYADLLKMCAHYCFITKERQYSQFCCPYQGINKAHMSIISLLYLKFYLLLFKLPLVHLQSLSSNAEVLGRTPKF